MKIIKSNVDDLGSCNYCDKGRLSLGGHNLIYPYNEVILVEGNTIKSVFCKDCLDGLASYVNEKQLRSAFLKI